MSLITFSNVSKYFGSDLILDHVTFNINLKEKIALIGQNGAGKTTIFKLILKELEPTLLPKEDKPGQISILKDTRIGYLDQNALTDIENTVLQELLLPFKETLEIEAKINKYSENMTISIEEYNELLEKYKELDGYTYKNKIEELVSKFSFDLSILDKKVKTLSGGERMKIAFIKILLFKFDVLLLDEPTNHLDISTIEWLENYLTSYPGTIIFISHDKYFVSKLATRVFELENHKLEIYNTDFDHYEILKKERYESLLKQVKIETALIEKYKRFIEFYKPKPRFVSRAKDREKKLEKLEKNRAKLPPNSKKQIKFELEGGNISTRQLLEIEDLSIGYKSPLIPNISLKLYGQDKVAIIGDNGVGKTTLIKTLLNEIKPLKGKIKEYRVLKYGYVKQNDFEFSSNLTALEFLKNNYPNKLEKELRNILGNFNFKDDEVFKSVNVMSNGEKMRLVLANLSLSDYDILVLDEPTNHLDMFTKESLISALKHYKGCILFISHDRYFINQLANFVLYLSKSQVIYNEGNYDDIQLLLEKQKNIKPKTLKEVEESLKKEFPKKTKLSNNMIIKLNNELKEIEDEIAQIDEKLESEFTKYSEFDELNDRKEDLEERYVEILEIFENDK